MNSSKMIPHKLKELEEKVMAILQLLAKARQERASLEATLGELQAEVSLLRERLKKEETKREEVEGDLRRLEAEREEVRSKVEELLSELAKIEALQGGGP